MTLQKIVEKKKNKIKVEIRKAKGFPYKWIINQSAGLVDGKIRGSKPKITIYI